MPQRGLMFRLRGIARAKVVLRQFDVQALSNAVGIALFPSLSRSGSLLEEHGGVSRFLRVNTGRVGEKRRGEEKTFLCVCVCSQGS